MNTRTAETNWFDRLRHCNVHYAVRNRRPIDGFKPFLKGFTAAQCHANIIVPKTEGDAIYYLGSDYPYLLEDDGLGSVLEMIERVKASFGQRGVASRTRDNGLRTAEIKSGTDRERDRSAAQPLREGRLGRVGRRQPAGMRTYQVGLHQSAGIAVFGEQVDMHLVGATLGAFVAKMGEIERHGVVLGLAEGERHPRSVVEAPHQDIICPGQGGAADQAVDAVQIAAARSPAPIVECLGKSGIGAKGAVCRGAR